MDTNKATIIIILFLSAILNMGCPHMDCSKTIFDFSSEASISPDEDSVSIGDTLWLNINIPTTLKDINKDMEINYSDAANLGTVIYIYQLRGNGDKDEGLNNFKLILRNGIPVNNHLQPNLLREYLFTEQNKHYLFELGFVPQKTGIFALSLSDAANVFRKNDKCDKANFAITISNSDHHNNYYLENYPDYTGQINQYEFDRMYCFKVKE